MSGPHPTVPSEDLEDRDEGEFGSLEPWLLLCPTEEPKGDVGSVPNRVEDPNQEVRVGNRGLEVVGHSVVSNGVVSGGVVVGACAEWEDEARFGGWCDEGS